ncbi:MAG: dihydroorotase [Pseudomonadota bacterium]
MQLLIRRGRVIDPGRIDATMDILIANGVIEKISPEPIPAIEVAGMHVIDASGKIVTPGLIDMHVHFREPGHEYKETIETGSRAAAAGGFTAVCAMPNTVPVNDNRQVTESILEKAQKAGGIRVYPVAAISFGLKGEALTEFGDLKEGGAVAVSDDGRPVANSRLMRRALEYAKGFGLLVISHCEDPDLSRGGAMNEGETATRLGLPGIPNAAESVMVMRDIALCELTCAPVHIAHVSSLESVRAIREAKMRGLPVTAETAPHYFTLTDAAVNSYNTHAKMNPPLRSEKDRQAILEGLRDGTIDVIATDHAPHSSIEKEVEFDQAANGIIGLETSLCLGLNLVEKGILTLEQLIRKMSSNPAKILGIDNRLKAGNPADITVIDPEKTYVIDAKRFRSKSRNTPFDGWEVKGKAVCTIVGGKIVFDDFNTQRIHLEKA